MAITHALNYILHLKSSGLSFTVHLASISALHSPGGWIFHLFFLIFLKGLINVYPPVSLEGELQALLADPAFTGIPKDKVSLRAHPTFMPRKCQRSI